MAYHLLSAQAVRERTHRLYALARENRLDHFALNLHALPALAARVAAVTRTAYPALNVPFHARWRHFIHKGHDRWATIDRNMRWPSPAHRARAAFDLAIVSVLLDAGAGMAWRYPDPVSGTAVGRSEGLALASFDMFASGLFSNDPDEPFRADAERLAMLSIIDLAEGFRVGPDNPMAGLAGRAALLNALGQTLLLDTALRDADGDARPGALFDLLAREGTVTAPDILGALLLHLGPIWPSRIMLDGIPLGDCWPHPALADDGACGNLVPFHKLSQWLSYSLIEPLQWAGVIVTDIGGLTGLAEYRNGGLFIDGGVIVPKDAAILSAVHAPASPLIVEWRALTVQLLDEIAPLVRAELGVSAIAFPLAKVLEGGTWATGRLLARERRVDGGPPLNIASDGTVF